MDEGKVVLYHITVVLSIGGRPKKEWAKYGRLVKVVSEAKSKKQQKHKISISAIWGGVYIRYA